jgi:hypothetical protein
MKPSSIFLIAFLLAGIFPVTAQDLIILRNGYLIDGKVLQVSTTQVIYQRLDDLDGPGVIIPRANVLSIRYEDGRVEVLNPAPPATQQDSAQANKPNTPANRPNTPATQKNTPAQRSQAAANSDEVNVGINANPSGLLLYGPSLCLEIGKGKFNSEINFIVPAGIASGFGGGFGALATFNAFWERWNGGFYLGGGIGYIYKKDNYYLESIYQTSETVYYEGNNYSAYKTVSEHKYYNLKLLTAGLNIGYKFVTSSGAYFRTGGYIGGGLDFGILGEKVDRLPLIFYFKPDLAVGYCF